MDKIRIDFFDILGYLVPGSALLAVAWLGFDGHVQAIWQIPESLQKIDQKSIFVLLLVAYVAGFVVHALGSELYKWYKRKHPLSNSDETNSVQEKWALIREYGEKHISMLERWYALRALSQNLAAVSLITALMSVGKIALYGHWHWLWIFGSAAALCLVFLKRAEVFRNLLHKDIEAVMLKLRLLEK